MKHINRTIKTLLGVLILLTVITFVTHAAAQPFTIVDTIPVGTNPRKAVITPSGDEVYVSNGSSNTVSVISTATNAVTHTIAVGSQPEALAVSPDGALVYVGNMLGNVSVINTQTKAVTTIDVGGRANDLAITSDGQKIYVTTVYGPLKKIRTSDNFVSDVYSATCPMYVVFTPDGSRAYVNYQCYFPPCGSPDGIGVFNAVTDSFIQPICGFPNVGGPVAISPDGTQVWANGLDVCRNYPAYFYLCPIVPGGVVNVIRTSDNAVIETIGFPNGAGLITIFPDSLLAAVGSASQLLILDTQTFAVVDSLDIAASGSLAFTPDGRWAYAPVPSENAVKVLQIVANQPPVADAGEDQIVSVGDTVPLDGSASYDPDDDPLTYSWSFVSTPEGSEATIANPTAMETSFVPDLPGEFIVSLVVNDGTEDSEPDTVTITVIPATLSGWVWMVGGSSDIGYSLEEGDLVYFYSPEPVWEYNITTGQWSAFDPVGWVYIFSPFYYVLDTGTFMFVLSPVSGLWVYHNSTGQWEEWPSIFP